MKKVFLVFLIIVSIFCLSSCFNSSKNTSESYSIHKEIIPGLYFQRDSMTENSIFFSDNATSQYREYIVKDKMIFRYAKNNEFIAYHWNSLTESDLSNTSIRNVYGSEYSIIDDCITIYDCLNNKYIDFANQTEFQRFCETQNINFFWMYPSDFNPKITKVASFEIHDFESESVCDYVVKNNMIIYEGYISDITVEKNKISFRLQVPHKNIWEFQDSENNSLNISFEQSVGRKQIGILLYEDIYFDEYITVNTDDQS